MPARYIEFYIEHEEHAFARSVIIPSGKTAEEASRFALDEAKTIHPDATCITEIVHKELTSQQCNEIQNAIVAGTWLRWPDEEE